MTRPASYTARELGVDMTSDQEVEQAEPNWVTELRATADLVDPAGEFDLTERVSVWTYVPEITEIPWRVTSRPLVPAAPPKACRNTGVLIVAGVGSTISGRRELLVRDFTCTRLVQFVAPSVLVATPTDDRPVFLSARSDVIQGGDDIRLRFLSWDQAGQPTQVSFRWHLFAPGFEPIS